MYVAQPGRGIGRSELVEKELDRLIERIERLTDHEGQTDRLGGVLGVLVAHHQIEDEKYRIRLTKGE